MDTFIPQAEQIRMRADFKTKAYAMFGNEAREKINLKKTQQRALLTAKIINEEFFIKWFPPPNENRSANNSQRIR